MCRTAPDRFAIGRVATLTIAALFSVGSAAQSQPTQAAAPTPNQSTSPKPVITFHASSRMVTLEVVARDHQGKVVPGLTSSDFQVFERSTGRKKETREQKIAVFQAFAISELISQAPVSLQVPSGVYTNHVTLHNQTVPPTILLVDGINTELGAQLQVHVQMVRMLGSLPKDVPVAVFLLGRRLQILQGFTTDPALLKAALDRSSSTQVAGITQMDPRDEPDTVSAFTGNILANDPNMASNPVQAIFLQAIQRFEKETYASNMDMRVRQTVGALMSLAHNVSGYPGRKNLLWISSSFPLVLNPELDVAGITQNVSGRTSAPAFRAADTSAFVGMRNYGAEMQAVATALSDAKVSVYPIDISGVKTETFFDAGTRPHARTADTGATAIKEMGALDREAQLNASRRDTMEDLAAQTGGRICTEDNDLGDCIRRAVNDSSAFYEISYYPTWPDWNGEFRKVMVKTRRPGLRLAYREGYFAQTESTEAKAQQADLQQAACEDYLNATSILVMAQAVPSDSREERKYFVAIDPAMLTFTPAPNGAHELKINVAACTFDESGKPLQLINDPINHILTSKEYESVQHTHGFAHVIKVPGHKPAGVRLVVQDVPSGRLGSVNMPVPQSAVAATATGKGSSQAPVPR